MEMRFLAWEWLSIALGVPRVWFEAVAIVDLARLGVWKERLIRKDWSWSRRFWAYRHWSKRRYRHLGLCKAAFGGVIRLYSAPFCCYSGSVWLIAWTFGLEALDPILAEAFAAADLVALPTIYSSSPPLQSIKWITPGPWNCWYQSKAYWPISLAICLQLSSCLAWSSFARFGKFLGALVFDRFRVWPFGEAFRKILRF